MKRPVVACLAAVMMLQVASDVAHARIYNGSFESWDVVGWSVTNNTGIRSTDLSLRPAGVVRTMTSWGANFNLDTTLAPVTGQRFLSINTRANANFLGDGHYETFLSQTFTCATGDILSGWAAFFNGDSAALDSAWVRIIDSEGNLMATPWSMTSGVGAALLTNNSAPDWDSWQWAAPLEGNYLLQLGVSTSGANNNASYGFFDGVTLQSNPVPEPATMTFALIGGLALVVIRQRRR